MKRVMCVCFPQWPLQRLARDRPELRDKPVGLILASQKPQVVLCSAAAVRLGVRPGLPAAEARAMVAALHTEEEDAGEDRRALEHLALWLGRFSPVVGLEEGPAPQ